MLYENLLFVVKFFNIIKAILLRFFLHLCPFAFFAWSLTDTIILTLLQDKLSELSVPNSTCRWITDCSCDSCLTRGSMWHWGNTSQTSWPSAPAPLKAASFPHYSSPFTQTAAPAVISVSSFRSLRMTPLVLTDDLNFNFYRHHDMNMRDKHIIKDCLEGNE